ncbi:hypothetical protein ACTQ1D_03940 [Parafannyhessea umbonata]|uniref:hypothetical protein n=1 Tax=Parafannyhessea umbonata TaxID=604330 RepID=UPI003F9554A9
MSEKKQARLVERAPNTLNGGTFEVWDMGHGRGIYVDEFEDSVRCDRCRTTFNRPWEPFKYCPNCGAEVVDDE